MRLTVFACLMLAAKQPAAEAPVLLPADRFEKLIRPADRPRHRQGRAVDRTGGRMLKAARLRSIATRRVYPSDAPSSAE